MLRTRLCPVVRVVGSSRTGAPALAAVALAVAAVLGTAGPAAAVDVPVERLGGADRVATAIATSQYAFPSGGADGVVIARADGFADALSGSVLAARTRSPVLLTGGAALDPRVRSEVARAARSGATVYLLGSADVVSDQVAAALRADGHAVVRLGGEDRYETAALIARRVQPKADAGGTCAYTFVTGRDFPDGLSAAALGEPLLLTDGDSMPAASAAEVRRCAATAAAGEGHVSGRAVGGPGSDAFSSFADQEYGPSYRAQPAIVGFDRYETSAKVLDEFSGNGEEPAIAVAVATGTNYPDALVAAGTLASAKTGPIVHQRTAGPVPVALTRPERLPDWTVQRLSSPGTSLSGFFVMGSPDVVSDAVVAQLRSIRSRS